MRYKYCVCGEGIQKSSSAIPFIRLERERKREREKGFVRSPERSNWKSELWLLIDRISYARKVLRLDFDRTNCKIMIYFEKLRFSPHLSRYIAGILLLIFCNSFQLVSNFPIPIHPWFRSKTTQHRHFPIRSDLIQFDTHSITPFLSFSIRSKQMDPNQLFSSHFLDGQFLLYPPLLFAFRLKVFYCSFSDFVFLFAVLFS